MGRTGAALRRGVKSGDRVRRAVAVAAVLALVLGAGASSAAAALQEPQAVRSGATSTQDLSARVQQSTVLGIYRSFTIVKAGNSSTVRATLTAGGTAVPDRPVTLQYRYAGTTTWYTVATKNTSSTGKASFTVSPKRHTEYRLRHSSNSSYGAATSDTVRVSVRAALTLTTSRLSGLLGRTTTFKGRVTPVYSKNRVLLQRLVNGSWTTIVSKQPSSTGYYTFSVKPTSTSVRTYRVRVLATDRRYAATSSTKKVIRYKATITSIVYDASGDDRYNLNGEYVVVKNPGVVNINLGGWDLSANPQRRTLPSYTLRAGATVRIHTGSGSQRAGHIYLGYKAPIWNNDGDVGRLYDRYGNRSSTYQY